MFMYANDVHYDVLDAYVHVRQWRGLRQGRWRKRPDATSTASKTGLPLFAGDSLIFRVIETFEDCILLQKDLEALEIWENMWQMQFRPDKCGCIRFTGSQNPILLDYYLKSVKLDMVKT